MLFLIVNDARVRFPPKVLEFVGIYRRLGICMLHYVSSRSDVFYFRFIGEGRFLRVRRSGTLGLHALERYFLEASLGCLFLGVVCRRV